MADFEKGFDYYPALYKRNYAKHLPADKSSNILVVSAGPGYFVHFLSQLGYTNVRGIDSDAGLVEYAKKRNIDVSVAGPLQYLAQSNQRYDLLMLEQEINHLSQDETLDMLALVRSRLNSGGSVVLNATNYANPITVPDHLAHNMDHHSAWTANSLEQAFEYTGYRDSGTYPLDNYVLYKNPLNYVAKAATGFISLMLRVVFKMYGKDEKIFTKRVISVGRV